MHELQTKPRGRVMAPIVLGSAVASAIYRYLAQHPAVSIDLELDERVDLLADGFDIAIVTGKVDSTGTRASRAAFISSIAPIAR